MNEQISNNFLAPDQTCLRTRMLFFIKHLLIYSLLVPGLTVFVAPLFAQNNDLTKNVNAKKLQPGFVHEEKFVQINGIDQWITIHGNATKPVILFIHGGPGSPISPYSANVYQDWEKDFIIVHWDQRGSGKTFGRVAPEELTREFLTKNPLTLEQMTNDGVQLSTYLLQHLGKKKLILFGSSWGSALAVKMATQAPGLYYAYVGHSQVVDPADDLPLYNNVYQLAAARKDTASLLVLEGLGKPPYEQAKKVGQLLRIVKKYEQANADPAPAAWFVPSPPYANEQDKKNREDGDDYSFVNYVGDKRLGVTAIRSTINLMKDNLDINIPVYLIQGAADLLTPEISTRAYFDKLRAPQKKYYLLPRAAHGFNRQVVDTQLKICKAIKI